MKAGQFETCFIIQTYNRLSRSLSRVAARSYIHVSRKLAYAFYDFLAEGILISVDNVAAVAISVVAATTIRCGNLTIWTVSRWYTKFTIILKPGGGEKRIPQWTFYFFEKAILKSVAEFVHTLFYYRAYCIIFRSKSWKIWNFAIRKYELNILIELFFDVIKIFHRARREGEFRPISSII